MGKLSPFAAFRAVRRELEKAPDSVAVHGALDLLDVFMAKWRPKKRKKK